MALATSTQRDLTTGEAVRMMRVSQQTIIRSCDRGVLESYKLPCSRFRRIVRDSLYAYMLANNFPMSAWGDYRPATKADDAA
jgi:two-component system OmpR family response regulator